MNADNKQTVLDAASQLVSLTETPMDGREARNLAGTLEAIASALRRGATNAQATAEATRREVEAVEPSTCGCYTCVSPADARSRMILCILCGNKRCPKATHHDNACTNSNEPGQAGTRYA